MDSKRLGVRLLDFLLSDLCVWQESSESATLFIRVSSSSIAACIHLQWWLTPRSSSWLATSTLCPNRGASNACPRDIPFASPATILKAVTGTWSLRLRWCGQEMPETSAKIPADREAPIYGKGAPGARLLCCR